MTITVKINDLVGLSVGSLEFDRVALVAGPTGAGKTTIAAAVAAAVGGDPLIRGIRAKNRLGAVVRRGKAHGMVVVGNAHGEAAVSYPTGEVYTKGAPPVASDYAVGRRAFMDLDDETRAGVLSRLIGAEVTAEELLEEFRAHHVEQLHEAVTMQLARGQSYDEIAKKAEQHARAQKTAWTAITKEAWGQKKAEDWAPEGFSRAMVDIGLVRLQERMHEADAALADARANVAVSAAEIERLQMEAASAAQIEEDIAALEDRIAARESTRLETQGALEALPATQASEAQACPFGCLRRFMKVQSGKVVATDPPLDLAPEVLQGLTKKKEALRGELAKLDHDIRVDSSTLASLRVRLEDAHQAARDAQNARTQGTSRAELTQAEKAALEATTNVRALEAWQGALRIHGSIMSALAVAAIMAPDGIRKRKLQDRLAQLNEALAAAAAVAGLPDVRLDEELVLWMGEAPFGLLSEGEQVAASAVLHGVLAQKDGSQIMVVDQLDHLTGKQRSGVLKWLLSTGIPTIVCCGAAGPDRVPNLRKVGVGVTFWLQNGTIEEVR